MREIKFRWFVDGQMQSEFDGWVENIGINEAIACAQSYGHQIMQYTGLKDVNDKEIYEGDICKVHMFTQELGENMGVMEGEREFVARTDLTTDGCCLLNGLPDKPNDSGPIWAYGGFHEESLEVIGNIYENPELLTRTQKVTNA